MAVDNEKIKFSDLYTIITGTTHTNQSVSLSSFRGEGTVPTGGLIGISLHFKGQTFASNDHPTIESVRERLTDANLGIMYNALTGVVGTMYNINSNLAYNNTSISDGGADMYDGGNKISFNSNSNYRTYTNTITSNGVGTGSYFVKIGPSATNRFFIFVSDIDSLITNVQINGNNGADGYGSVVVGDETITKNNIDYKIYWKSVHDGRDGDPTINHIWILKNISGISRDYSTNTDNDYHKVITNGVIKRIYYIMWAGATNDGHTSSTEVTAIANTFLGLVNDPLYAFTSHTFTNCGATGQNGPTLANCTSSYSSASWTSNTDYFNITTQGIQEWTVPNSGAYKMELWGASSGDNSNEKYGKGAKIIGTFNLNANDIIYILVGQKPIGGTYAWGGGGGSFVWINSTPLIIAGGGGGSNNGGGDNTSGIADGKSGEDGGYGTTQATIGYGGDEGGGNWAGGGGAGWFSNGVSVDSSKTYAGFGGKRPLEGGVGGGANVGHFSGNHNGGFGGGGGSGVHMGGGGGGYTGGEGANYDTKSPDTLGGGGGSYNSGTSPENVSGYNDGHGRVIITLL